MMKSKTKIKRLESGGRLSLKKDFSKKKRTRRSTDRSPMQFTVTPFDTSSSASSQTAVEKFVLNPYLSSKTKDLKRLWKNGKSASEDILELDAMPFKHCAIKHLLKGNSSLEELCSELMELPYDIMHNDLYSFKQTNSLFIHCDSHPYIKSILELIRGPLRSWIQEVTGKKFSDKVTATASQYKYTDRLLCHDDHLDDRSVAFIFYLSKDWDVEKGGSLDLFTCDSEKQPQGIVKSVIPSFGSFAFFEVSQYSYHQVAEIVCPKSVRLSINGWFHGKALPLQDQWFEPLPKMCTPIQPSGCSQDDWINSKWLSSGTTNSVQSVFHRELSIALPAFLKSSVYEEMLLALRENNIVWEPRGPTNRKRFEVAKSSTLPKFVKKFLQFIQSKTWFRLLSQYTVDIDPDMTPKPKCWFEVQRWKAGDYTILFDNDPVNNSTGMELHLYLGVAKRRKKDQGGDVHYLGPERDESGCLEPAAQLEPQNNTASIVARIEGMAQLTKYLDHRNMPFFKIFAHYSQSLD